MAEFPTTVYIKFNDATGEGVIEVDDNLPRLLANGIDEPFDDELEQRFATYELVSVEWGKLQSSVRRSGKKTPVKKGQRG